VDAQRHPAVRVLADTLMDRLFFITGMLFVILLLTLVIAPLVVAVVAATVGRRAPVLVARLGTATAAAGLLIAIAGPPSGSDHLAAALPPLIFGSSAAMRLGRNAWLKRLRIPRWFGSSPPADA